MFSFIKDRTRIKVQSWKEKFLSQAGKEIPLKFVIVTIPTYVMSCFFRPKSICKSIKSIQRKFWWGSKGKMTKKSIGLDETNLKKCRGNGGLGFRDLHNFNLTFLVKKRRKLSIILRAFGLKFFKDFISQRVHF